MNHNLCDNEASKLNKIRSRNNIVKLTTVSKGRGLHLRFGFDVTEITVAIGL